MKVLSLILCLLLLTGCASTVAKLEQMEEAIETKADIVEETIETQVETALPEPAPNATSTNAPLTELDAQQIALEHAGFTADQVTGLQVRYEIDDRIPEYEVEFRVDRMEYDYTIHAETGEILSFDMDN